MTTGEKIHETWDEVGTALGYSGRHARRIFYQLIRTNPGFRTKLKHWFGPGRRIKIADSELEEVRKEVFRGCQIEFGFLN